jgi:hypothetical protein
MYQAYFLTTKAAFWTVYCDIFRSHSIICQVFRNQQKPTAVVLSQPVKGVCQCFILTLPERFFPVVYQLVVLRASLYFHSSVTVIIAGV